MMSKHSISYSFCIVCVQNHIVFVCFIVFLLGHTTHSSWSVYAHVQILTPLNLCTNYLYSVLKTEDPLMSLSIWTFFKTSNKSVTIPFYYCRVLRKCSVAVVFEWGSLLSTFYCNACTFIIGDPLPDILW